MAGVGNCDFFFSLKLKSLRRKKNNKKKLNVDIFESPSLLSLCVSATRGPSVTSSLLFATGHHALCWSVRQTKLVTLQGDVSLQLLDMHMQTHCFRIKHCFYVPHVNVQYLLADASSSSEKEGMVPYLLGEFLIFFKIINTQ